MKNLKWWVVELNELALFAGAGGGILGGHLLGWRTVAAVEIEDYPRRVLLQRQADGILPRFPIWDDVRTFDGKPWRGKIDIVTGGFPCQDISAAGKGAGIEGERSGLWKEMARIIGEVRPRRAYMENSPLLVGRGLAAVLGELAEMGFDARWGIVGADDCGAPHRRKRIWILANRIRPRLEGYTGHERNRNKPRWLNAQPFGSVGKSGLRNAASSGFQNGGGAPLGQSGPQPELKRSNCKIPNAQNERILRRERSESESRSESGIECRGETFDECGKWWAVEPELGRVAHGVAHRVDRLKAIGNGQVPIVAAVAYEILKEEGN